jgi:hypothetical protein
VQFEKDRETSQLPRPLDIVKQPSQHTADIESMKTGKGELQIEMRNVELNRNASSATEKTTLESTSMYEC